MTISSGSVGAKNNFCCDLFSINWSKGTLESGISLLEYHLHDVL